MNINDKIKLVNAYKEKYKLDSEPIEIGKSSFTNSTLDNIDSNTSKPVVKKKSVSPSIASLIELEKDITKVEETKVNTLTVKPCIVDDSDDDFDLDDTFLPMSFSKEVMSKDEEHEDLYEVIKGSIDNIKCSEGLDYAYSQFDTVLKNLSSYNSDELTNSQLLILVSLMITKLEELNRYNYPEISLESVQTKLKNDGKKIMSSSNLNYYFFESFYRYYMEVEHEQYKNLADKYSDRMEEFTMYQLKKNEMLMALLKWLLY